MSVNKVILVGNLGKDPELRYTPSGAAVATFSLATTNPFKDKDGNRQTEWHNIVAWRQLAEICGKFLHKGRQVYIEGRIQTRSYDDRDGNKRYITEIIAENMQMLGNREEGAGSGGGFGGGQGFSNEGGSSYSQGGGSSSRGGNKPSGGFGGSAPADFDDPVFNPDDEIPF